MKKRRSMKWLGVVMLSMMAILAGCTSGTDATTDKDKETTEIVGTDTYSEDLPVATIKVKAFGTIEVTLLPEMAPNTVNNFISLANSGFYDGLIFHRIIDGFMIQGGDPEGTGAGDPGYSIEGEFASNGFESNTLKHTKGVISMARAMEPNSAGSQFFIMTGDSTNLDGKYAAFGQVTAGMDVLEQIGKVETGMQDKPLEDVVIESITVDTKGQTYSQPNKTEN